MFWLKCCLKCKGDLYDGTDIHGLYVACLQCGRLLTADQEQSLRQQTLVLGALRSAKPRQVGRATAAIAGNADALGSAA